MRIVIDLLDGDDVVQTTDEKSPESDSKKKDEDLKKKILEDALKNSVQVTLVEVENSES